jgi:hypothetical protein
VPSRHKQSSLLLQSANYTQENFKACAQKIPKGTKENITISYIRKNGLKSLLDDSDLLALMEQKLALTI